MFEDKIKQIKELIQKKLEDLNLSKFLKKNNQDLDDPQSNDRDEGSSEDVGPENNEEQNKGDFEEKTIMSKIMGESLEKMGLDEQDDEEQSNDEKNKKLENKKNVKIDLKSDYIKYGLAVILLYFLLDMFLLNNGDENMSSNQVSRRTRRVYKKSKTPKKKRFAKSISTKNKKVKRKKVKVKIKKAKPPERVIASNKAKGSSVSEEVGFVDPVGFVDIKEGSDESKVEKNNEKKNTESTNHLKEKPSDSSDKKKLDKKISDQNGVVTDSNPVLSTEKADKMKKLPLDEKSEVNAAALEKQKREIATEEKEKVKKMNNLKKKFLETGFESDTQVLNSKYVDPPDYQTAGRGLVYNCKGHHWACVDKKSYLDCKQNNLWSIEKKEKSSCIARDVYASFDDCKIVQIYNINTKEKTLECDTNLP